MLCAHSDQEVSTLALNFRSKCILFFEFLDPFHAVHFQILGGMSRVKDLSYTLTYLS